MRPLGLVKALTKSGPLRKEGAGTLVLSGANTYPGGTLISAGTLAGGGPESFGSGTITNNAALRDRSIRRRGRLRTPSRAAAP